MWMVLSGLTMNLVGESSCAKKNGKFFASQIKVNFTQNLIVVEQERTNNRREIVAVFYLLSYPFPLTHSVYRNAGYLTGLSHR